MQLISNKVQLLRNIDTIKNYLNDGNEEEKSKTMNLIKRGTCFVAYQIGNEVRFAPSRFIGYSDNNIEQHLRSAKDGRETNKVIISVLADKPLVNRELESKYNEYCSALGIQPNSNGAFGVQRKYWKLNLQDDFNGNKDYIESFPEGKIVERKHKLNERNSQVVLLAKENFKKQHGKLFCQVCDFDFEKIYGPLGKDFIEAHHTIAVSEMLAGHITKVDDIVLLCPNCHRMVHKKRPWLSKDELSKILKD